MGKNLIQKIFKDLNYLNIREYQGFCDKHGIPYIIHVKTSQGLKKTGDKDRKKIVLARIRHFISTGKIQGPTVFSKKVVCFEKLKRFSPSTRLHYGQYDKKNPKFIAFMKKLTDGKFKNGMIARVVLREFWTDGVAPTLKQYAHAWEKADVVNTKRHPEAAYLTDVAEGVADSEWKKLRIEKAKKVLKVLANYLP